VAAIAEVLGLPLDELVRETRRTGPRTAVA
jgi:hypothetical protein